MSFYHPEAPPLTIEALAEWITTHPLSNEYIYQDPFFCLLGQYFSDCGAIDAIAESAYEQFPSYKQIAEPKPHTFGAALQRAEKLLALPPPNDGFPPGTRWPADREEVHELRGRPSESELQPLLEHTGRSDQT